MAAVTTATAYAEVVSALDKSNAPEKESVCRYAHDCEYSHGCPVPHPLMARRGRSLGITFGVSVGSVMCIFGVTLASLWGYFARIVMSP